MLEVGVLHKIVERRILVESLGVLLGPKSVIEPTGVIRRELGSHVPESSDLADLADQPQCQRISARDDLDCQLDESWAGKPAFGVILLGGYHPAFLKYCEEHLEA